MLRRYFPWLATFFISLGETQHHTFVQISELNPDLQVKIHSGVIQGRRQLTERQQIPYYSFQGIPYAEPPVGDLRFRPPKPVSNWDGVLNAGKEASGCLQMSPKIQELFTSGSEDCLYLNIYTPLDPKTAENSTLLPVMVWIYGGGFVVGGSEYDVYGPDYLLENEIVVVTFNYRLGMFGFLSTGDLESPGNYGLKDQVEVLRWVRRNIRRFGGDPDLVTVFGQSAGAVSVQYLMVSPVTRGLFHRAIAESGSALCPWALQRNPSRVAFEMGLVSGIITTSTANLVRRLREINYGELKWTQLGATVFNFINSLNGLPFSPSLEPEHDGAFLTEKTYQALQEGRFTRVPFMTGVNSQESVMFLQLLDFGRPLLAQWDILPQVLVPDDMNIAQITDKTSAALKIKDFYFGNKLAAISTRQELLDYISDSQFLRPIRESALLSSRYVPVYFYVFSYEGRLGVHGNSDNREERRTKGVAHAEEMWYIWRKTNLTTANRRDNLVRDRTLKMWTNFAKTGNPTPSNDPLLDNVIWPAVRPNGDKVVNYLEINSELAVRKNPKRDAMKFWDSLYERYGNPPYDTY